MVSKTLILTKMKKTSLARRRSSKNQNIFGQKILLDSKG